MSNRFVYQLNDNGGQKVLTIETASNACHPVSREALTIVKDPGGRVMRFTSREEYVGRVALSENSWFKLEFPDHTVLTLRLSPPVIEPGPGQRVDHPGSVFSYRGQELALSFEKPKKPVFLSKAGRGFRALMPEDVAGMMQSLEDAGKALLEAGAFVGYDEVFVDLYLGVESGGEGRRGFEVVEVEREHKRGLGHFYKKEDPSQKAPPSATPAKDSTSGEPVGLPDPVPTATDAAPSPDPKPPAERPVPGSPEVAPASPPGRDGTG